MCTRASSSSWAFLGAVGSPPPRSGASAQRPRRTANRNRAYLRRAHPPPVPSARTEKREGKHAGVHPRKWALVVLLGRCGTSASSAQRPRRTTSRVHTDDQPLTPCTPASPPPSRAPEDHNEARTGGRPRPGEGNAPASRDPKTVLAHTFGSDRRGGKGGVFTA